MAKNKILVPGAREQLNQLKTNVMKAKGYQIDQAFPIILSMKLPENRISR